MVSPLGDTRAGLRPSATRAGGFAGVFGQIANSYFQRHGDRSEELAMIAAKNHGNGVANPYAHMRKDFDTAFCNTISDKNPRVAGPLRRTDCSLVSDGAAVLATDCAQGDLVRDAAARLSGVQVPGGRYRVLPGRFTVIDDAYNASPVAVRAALDALHAHREERGSVAGFGTAITPEELLELVGLDPKRTLESYPHELSGGQAHLTALASVLALVIGVTVMAVALTRGGQDGHEGLRKGAFGEQPAQQVGNAERHVEGVCPGAGAEGTGHQLVAQMKDAAHAAEGQQ